MKKIFLLVLILLMFTSCQKENNIEKKELLDKKIEKKEENKDNKLVLIEKSLSDIDNLTRDLEKSNYSGIDKEDLELKLFEILNKFNVIKSSVVIIASKNDNLDKNIVNIDNINNYEKYRILYPTSSDDIELLKNLENKKELTKKDIDFIVANLTFLNEYQRVIGEKINELIKKIENNTKNKILLNNDELSFFDNSGGQVFLLKDNFLNILENSQLLFSLDNNSLIISNLENNTINNFNEENSVVYNLKNSKIEKTQGYIYNNILEINEQNISIKKNLNIKNVFSNGFNIGSLKISKDGLFIGKTIKFIDGYIQISDFFVKEDGLYLGDKKIKDLSELKNDNFEITNKEINYKNKIILNKTGIYFYDKKITKDGIFYSNDILLNKDGIKVQGIILD